MKKELKITSRHDLPENPDAESIHALMPKNFSQDYYNERTDRNIGWITRKEQEKIKNSVVGIAGCGGMGGLVAATLIRLGVGEVRIADTEVFDISNLNRQFAATMTTVGKSKAFETAKMLRAIASDTKIVVYPEGINENTAEHFVAGCDVVCDEIEFWAIGSRILLHNVAKQVRALILNCSTAGHRVYCTKFTHDGMHISEVLELEYAQAKKFQDKIQNGTATKDEIRNIMNLMLRIAAPELPEYSTDTEKYSTVAELKKRLFVEIRASIIATNPPMAAGFMANQVLFHLLLKSDISRNFITPPSMPSYLMFDAGTLEGKCVEKKWW